MPISCTRNAPDITSAIAGDIAPSETVEIAKVIDGYMKAFQIAEPEERMARMELLNDAELMRIAKSKIDGRGQYTRFAAFRPAFVLTHCVRRGGNSKSR